MLVLRCVPNSFAVWCYPCCILPFAGSQSEWQRLTKVARQLEARAMPEHVRVNAEGKVGLLAGALDHEVERLGRERRAALGREHEQRWRLLAASEPRERPSARYGASKRLVAYTFRFGHPRASINFGDAAAIETFKDAGDQLRMPDAAA
jgi:hypothetical protein